VVAAKAGAMIASLRGLAVAAAIAVVLAVVAALDVTRTPSPVDRTLVPGFDPARVIELVWERAGRPVLRVVRDGERWRLEPTGQGSAGATGPAVAADAGAIGDVLSALRGARWHRRGAKTPARATLTVVSGAERRVLGIGAPLGGGQTWMTVEDRGVLVDDWVVRALDRDALALRIKTPLADIAGARTIAIDRRSPIAGGGDPDGSAGGAGGGAPRGIDREARGTSLVLEGRPRRLAGAAGLVIAEELAGELERALAQATIVRLPDSPVAAHGLAITAGAELGPADRSAVRLAIGGSCPGAPELVAASGTAGDGCIERAAAVAIERAVGRLQQPAGAIVEPRPIPFEVARVVLADGTALETAPPRLAGEPADPARVEELLHALAAPAEVTAAPARPPVAQIIVEGAGVAITLDLFAERTLARRGEPIGLRLAPGAWNLLVRPSRELRDPALWLEEPTTITALRIDEVRYQRGQVIDAWTRQTAGGAATPIDGAPLEALVAQLAAPRALGFVDDAIATAHRVTIEITPPAGPATERVLEIGAPRRDGCPARGQRDTLLLPASMCLRIAALAK
jgi:hypothetical protein